MSNVGIIGHGFVGQAVEYGFKGCCDRGHNLIIYDKYKYNVSLEMTLDKSDIIFVCLPTPFNEDKLEIDLSIYDEVMDEICSGIGLDEGKILVIKSTVVPGTTQKYAEKYPHVPFIFNPEFLTEANYLNDFVNADRIVIGGNNNWAVQTLIMLYRSMPYFVDTPILKMGSTAAEIVKYQCNVLMATKVSIANIFYDMCEKFDVKYEDVKAAVEKDPRIGSNHISVSSERGFGGKCFVKDLGAIIGCCNDLGVDAEVLKEVFEYNNRIRETKDWREIAGATVGGRDYGNNE